jgi:hypothetical protein
MRIVSNTPSSFERHDELEVFQLGEEYEGISLIVLMLEKNWGSSSIKKIQALLRWVSSYPETIPCYIVGCETTIPDPEFKRFRHKDRDSAVRSLCNEVLQRSKSIGVRGELTYRYLTEELGFDNGRIDVIYDHGGAANPARLKAFIDKNGLPADFEITFAKFQKNPRVIYEAGQSFSKDVIIGQPYVVIHGDVTRVNADIEIDGETTTLWCETSKEFERYFLWERADAFLSAIVPFAMRARKDIICKVPVTEQFLHNITEILIPQLCDYDERLYRTQIHAKGDASELSRGNAVATGMSCGVDSLHALQLYGSPTFASMKLTHLYCGNYLYGNAGPVYDRAKAVSKDINMPLVTTATNINEVLNLPHYYTHFFKLMFGVLSLRKLFRLYYYSTTYDFGHFDLKNNSTSDTAAIELLLLYVFSCSDFQIITAGAKSSRVEKTRALCELPVARKFLNVCLDPRKESNCGKCGKCRRTLMTLDMLQALDLFRDVFDIDEYRRNRFDSFVYLLAEKDSVFLSELYKYFSDREPEMIAQAEQVVKDKWRKSAALSMAAL